jgi:hypothetical protein
MQMSASPAQSEFSAGLLPVKLPVVAPAVRPVGPKNERLLSARPSLGTRTSFALVRFLVAFGIGVAATLGWQSHGDVAREMIANSSPQLGWLAAQAATVTQSAPDIAPAAPSPNAMSLDFDALRKSVDRIAASQEQITRTVDQLTASQEQMQRQITKLQAISQYIIYKNSEAAPRPTLARVPTPVPRPSQAHVAR